MRQQENDRIKQETFINIRKLAALDIVFHGSRLILAEFALAVVFCGAVGTWSLFAFFHNPSHPIFGAILGFFLLWLAVNYLPLLLYAISIVRGKSAEREVAFELEHKDVFARKYGLQSLLLVLPLVVLLLAIFQEVQKRSRLRSRH
ncbi:MAG: hypothetical protein ABI456_16685 [Ktedonobacteraceae bacterium]|nr:hypothetical protein [Chloroflexota bacterium]